MYKAGMHELMCMKYVYMVQKILRASEVIEAAFDVNCIQLLSEIGFTIFNKNKTCFLSETVVQPSF